MGVLKWAIVGHPQGRRPDCSLQNVCGRYTEGLQTWQQVAQEKQKWPEVEKFLCTYTRRQVCDELQRGRFMIGITLWLNTSPICSHLPLLVQPLKSIGHLDIHGQKVTATRASNKHRDRDIETKRHKLTIGACTRGAQSRNTFLARTIGTCDWGRHSRRTHSRHSCGTHSALKSSMLAGTRHGLASELLCGKMRMSHEFLRSAALVGFFRCWISRPECTHRAPSVSPEWTA